MAAANDKHSPPPLPILPPLSSSSSATSSAHVGLPILAISIIGILTMVLLLVSYYAFAIKCSMNWRHSDVINRFTISRPARRRRRVTVMSSSSTSTRRRGLEESEIRAIPIVQFKRIHENCECSICLTEFDEEEKLKLLPNCSHVFHVDCIDTWLQDNHNCPICRSNIMISAANHAAAAPPPPPPPPAFTARNQSSVIVDVGDEVDDDLSPRTEQTHASTPPTVPVPVTATTPVRKLHHACSMGDECINAGEMAEQFSFLRPMRRSVSMDFLNNNDLNLFQSNEEDHEDEEEDGKIRFFSFGHCRTRSSRSSSVLPIHFDPHGERPPELGRG